jgi:hypothetical protein
MGLIILIIKCTLDLLYRSNKHDHLVTSNNNKSLIKHTSFLYIPDLHVTLWWSQSKVNRVGCVYSENKLKLKLKKF